MNVLTVPKVELHCHLDCSISSSAARRIDPRITEKEFMESFALSQKCHDLSEFLSKVPRSLALLQKADHLRIVAEDLGRQLAEEYVCYAEIRFAPLLHLEEGLSAEEVIGAVLLGFRNAEAKYPIHIRVLLCTLRHFSKEQGVETAKLAHAFRDQGVVGIDLAADEAGFPLQPHVAAFEYALNKDIHRTAHAGEALGPDSVWDTVKRLRPERIGHGVRSIEDPKLLSVILEMGIHLEVCPGCNVQIGVYPNLASHPVHQLYSMGISLGINSDGRTIPQRSLAEEYADLRTTFLWGSREFYRVNLMALEASFCDPELKCGLRTQLQTEYASLLG